MNVAAAPHVNATVGIARPPLVIRRYSLRDFLTLLFYYWRIMACAFVVCALLGLAGAAMTKPVFVAQARLLVLYGGEYFYQPSTGQPGAAVALDRNEIMTSELEVLKNTGLAKQTLETVGVDRVYPGTKPNDPQALDAAARRMQSDLTLSSVAQSNVLDLGFRNRDPAVATAVLRALIDGYMTERIKVFQRATTAVVQAEQDSMLARVRAAEAALSGFAAAHDIVNLDEQTAILLQRQAGNRQARDETTQALSEAAARLAVVQQQLQNTQAVTQSFSDSDRSHALQMLNDSLIQLQIKRRDLASRYGDAYPDVQSLDRQIQWAQAQIASVPSREPASTRDGPNPLYQDLQRQAGALQEQLKGLQAKQADLATAAAATDARIRELASATSVYQDLKRNRDVLDETYRALIKSNEAAQVGSNAQGSRTANIRVVQPPEAAGARLNMRMILAVAGVVVGLVAALAVMALCNAFRQVFVTARDVSVALELPVVATAPRRRRFGRLSSSVLLGA